MLFLLFILLEGTSALTMHHQPSVVAAYDHLPWQEHQYISQLKNKNGKDLQYMIRSGRMRSQTPSGFFAADSEAYETFKTILDPIIEQYHDCDSYQSTQTSKKYDTGPNSDLFIDPNDEAILMSRVQSSRIRIARNINKYPFSSSMTKSLRKTVQEEILSHISHLKELKNGTNYEIQKLEPRHYKELVQRHLIFESQSEDFTNSGIFNDWSVGRGAQVSHDERFMVWYGEEDHLRIVYLAEGANFRHIYDKLLSPLRILENSLQFAYSSRLGYLSSSIQNIGTAFRISAHVKLDRLTEAQIRKLASTRDMQVRGNMGINSPISHQIYALSNKGKLCHSPKQIITNFSRRLVQIIRINDQLPQAQ